MGASMGDWLLRYALARLREPSTWRGLILLATAMGWAIRPDLAEAIVALGIALAGGVGVVAPDRPGAVPERVQPAEDRVRDTNAEPDPAAGTGRESLDRWESR